MENECERDSPMSFRNWFVRERERERERERKRERLDSFSSHHNTTQHNTTHHTQHTQHKQHNTTHTTHSKTQHNTTQHNTTQHNTTQHNTTQHNTHTVNGLRQIHSLDIIHRDLKPDNVVVEHNKKTGEMVAKI